MSKKIVHGYSLAGAASAAALPVGADAAALFGEECLMVVHIAASHGQKISKETAAQAITTGVLGTYVGTAIFEGLDIAYPYTIPAKIAVAFGVMEALGNATDEYFKDHGTL